MTPLLMLLYDDVCYGYRFRGDLWVCKGNNNHNNNNIAGHCLDDVLMMS